MRLEIPEPAAQPGDGRPRVPGSRNQHCACGGIGVLWVRDVNRRLDARKVILGAGVADDSDDLVLARLLTLCGARPPHSPPDRAAVEEAAGQHFVDDRDVGRVVSVSRRERSSVDDADPEGLEEPGHHLGVDDVDLLVTSVEPQVDLRVPREQKIVRHRGCSYPRFVTEALDEFAEESLAFLRLQRRAARRDLSDDQPLVRKPWVESPTDARVRSTSPATTKSAKVATSRSMASSRGTFAPQTLGRAKYDPSRALSGAASNSARAPASPDSRTFSAST